MSKVIFSFNGAETIIKCKIQEKLEEICNRFALKIGIDKNNLLFTYKQDIINEELTLKQLDDTKDKKSNKINIFVEEIKEEKNNIKLKEIKCPECNENVRISIKDYKINLFECKNGHEKNNILLNEYIKEENRYLSKIICKNCYKSNINNNDSLYKCITCENTLCHLCKLNHDKNHIIINYDKINCICNKHDEIFIKYCNQCKENICKLCEDNHKNHNIINFEEIFPNKNKSKKEMKQLKNNIDKLKEYIKDIINKLNVFIDNIEIYYNISYNITNNHENMNYKIIQNIKEFQSFNTILINDINKIIKDDNLNDKYNHIIDIYNKMTNKIDESKYNKYMNKIRYKFKKNPNLKYKIDLVDNNDIHGNNDIFEVFISYKDNMEYIVSPNSQKHNLDIYSLLNNKKILSLQGHKKSITSVRYFFNNKDYNEYLISADNNSLVIIWDITNNYNIKYQIFTQYKKKIYSCLLAFPPNSDDYIITSTNNISKKYIENSSTKIFSLNGGKFIKYIKDTNNKSIFYLACWINKNNDKYYIIQFSFEAILINDILEGSLFLEINENIHDGFLFNEDKDDFLCYSTWDGNIYIHNLYNESLNEVIDINIYMTGNMIFWNTNYLIVFEYNKYFKIIDLINKKIISNIKVQAKDEFKCIKKINHPIYGESLLIANSDKTIRLFSI